MSEKFDRVIAFILREEGGFVDDPRDPGGATKYGIAQRYHRDLDIRTLTEAAARDIYLREYWTPAHCEDLPYPLALLMMNATVNPGLAYSARFLQGAIGATVDGRIGPQTMAAIARLDGADRGKIGETCARFAAEHAISIASNQNVAVYGRGWLRRLSRALIVGAQEGA